MISLKWTMISRVRENRVWSISKSGKKRDSEALDWLSSRCCTVDVGFSNTSNHLDRWFIPFIPRKTYFLLVWKVWVAGSRSSNKTSVMLILKRKTILLYCYIKLILLDNEDFKGNPSFRSRCFAHVIHVMPAGFLQTEQPCSERNQSRLLSEHGLSEHFLRTLPSENMFPTLWPSLCFLKWLKPKCLHLWRAFSPLIKSFPSRKLWFKPASCEFTRG